MDVFSGWWFAVLPISIAAIAWFIAGRDRYFTSGNTYYPIEGDREKRLPVWAREHLPTVFAPLDGLTPAEIGVLWDFRVDLIDMVAEVLDLVRLGYLELVQTPDDFWVIRTEKEGDTLKIHQQVLLSHVLLAPLHTPGTQALEEHFGLKKAVQLSSRTISMMKVSHNFRVNLAYFGQAVNDSLVAQGYLHTNPHTTRKLAIGAGVFVFYLLFAIAFESETTELGMGTVWFLLGVFVAMIIGYFIPRRTALGHGVYRQLVGLRSYISLGKWRYEHYEKNLFLDELVPIAMALRVVSEVSAMMSGSRFANTKIYAQLDLPGLYDFAHIVAETFEDYQRFTRNK